MLILVVFKRVVPLRDGLSPVGSMVFVDDFHLISAFLCFQLHRFFFLRNFWLAYRLATRFWKESSRYWSVCSSDCSVLSGSDSVSLDIHNRRGSTQHLLVYCRSRLMDFECRTNIYPASIQPVSLSQFVELCSKSFDLDGWTVLFLIPLG